MKIDKIFLRKIKNSRGEDTFEVALEKGNLKVLSSVPAGKSKGEYEAKSISLDLAEKRFKKIKPIILSKDFKDLKEFDNFLISKAGENKKYLGVHLVLGLSIAFSRLLAKEEKIPLWQFLRKQAEENSRLLKSKNKYPLFFFNLINAGLHAPSGPSIQEYLLVPLKKPEESLKLAQKFFRELIKETKTKKNNFGDEGGIVIKETDPEYPLSLYEKVRKNLKLSFKDIRYSLDSAANSFYKKGKYSLYSGNFVSREELLNFYLEIVPKYKIFSLEDPFAEDDHLGFKKITEKLSSKILIIGDDLTVTHPLKIRNAFENKLINAVLIKPNQIGTVTETIKSIKDCHKYGFKTVISHRSGETDDSFIADLAVGLFAFGLKSGAPKPKERMAKYKRVVEIIKKAE